MTKIIAITGPSGSGKTTIANKLIEQIASSKSAVLISEDNYYRDQSHLAFDQRLLTNYDEPKAYEHNLLAKQLHALKNGEEVELPLYCFKQHTREQHTVTVAQPELIVVEGLMLLTNPALVSEFDVTAYIDTPTDICLLRRMNRDIKERGRTVECVTDQYLSAVRPSLVKYIEPSRTQANYSLSDFSNEQSLIDTLLSYL